MRILDIEKVPFWEVPYDSAGARGMRQGVRLPIIHGTVDALPAGTEALLVCSDLQGRAHEPHGSTPSRLLGEALADDLLLLAAAGEIPLARHIGIVLLGDLYADAEAQIRGTHGDVGPVWRAFANAFRWVIGVAGNHDVIGQPPVPGHANAHLIDGGIVTIDRLRIGGVGGVIGTSKQGRAWRRDERSFVGAMRSVLRAGPKVLLLHQGPDGGTVEQPGHPAIRAALEQSGPTLTLCGHVHWALPLATLPHGGQMLNVDGRAILLRAG